jgi:predicted glycoside hydrolase/deacetylase ChbG (UPF0249 family)
LLPEIRIITHGISGLAMNSRPTRILFHADDFGFNSAITDGILSGFRDGLLTSTSLLSNAPDASRAVEQWKKLEGDRQAVGLPSIRKRRLLDDPDQAFDLGVHLNLTQGRPLTGDRYPSELLDADGCFPGVFKLFACLWRGGDRFWAAVRNELEQQVQFVCDHGVKPSHLNGHQYVEMMPAIRSLMPALLDQFAIRSVRVTFEPSLGRSIVLARFQPWKWPMGWVKRRFAKKFRSQMDRLGFAHPDVFCGTMHAGCIDRRLMQSFLAAGRRFSSVEIALHPGKPAEKPREGFGSRIESETAMSGWRDPLAAMRPNELQLLVADELALFMEREHLRLGRLLPRD